MYSKQFCVKKLSLKKNLTDIRHSKSDPSPHCTPTLAARREFSVIIKFYITWMQRYRTFVCWEKLIRDTFFYKINGHIFFLKDRKKNTLRSNERMKGKLFQDYYEKNTEFLKKNSLKNNWNPTRLWMNGVWTFPVDQKSFLYPRYADKKNGFWIMNEQWTFPRKKNRNFS